ncbi:MAG: hypothetical protein ACLQIK_19330 [Mycobacterium sp.]|uniref:hypothetical protein n=1 Tax=Mycobacterium sp. TaxID=1785 RepID=UPI00284ACDDD|nr:hypothetical protein [Mycobacterium sp.]HKI41742.1 hypothetical protein [Mycobacterium sp.]
MAKAFTASSKNDLAEVIRPARVKRGLNWATIAEAIGKDPVWTVAALLGQDPLSAGEASTATAPGLAGGCTRTYSS